MAQEGSTESYLDDLSYTLGMASTPASRRKSRSARGAEETPKKSAPTTPPRSSSSRRKTGRQSRTEDAADSYKSTPPSAAKTHFSVEDAFATTSSAADSELRRKHGGNVTSHCALLSCWPSSTKTPSHERYREDANKTRLSLDCKKSVLCHLHACH